MSYDSKANTQRHYSDGTAVEEENELAAGIETKIENYGNPLTQRRHFDDEREDVTNKENAADTKGMVEIKEAARVERGEVEDCEDIRYQRKHFPGTTTTNSFR